jgi:hypothetical protein
MTKPIGDGINRDLTTGCFLPGNRSAKGRIKGSRNQLTEQMLKRFAARNMDGISVEEILFDIAQDPKASPEMRFKSAAKLSDLVFPKAQSVELEVEEADGLTPDEMDTRINQLMSKYNMHSEQTKEEDEEEAPEEA